MYLSTQTLIFFHSKYDWADAALSYDGVIWQSNHFEGFSSLKKISCLFLNMFVQYCFTGRCIWCVHTYRMNFLNVLLGKISHVNRNECHCYALYSCLLILQHLIHRGSTRIGAIVDSKTRKLIPIRTQVLIHLHRWTNIMAPQLNTFENPFKKSYNFI